MLSAFANILYIKEGISPSDLKSTKKDKPVPEYVLELLEKYKDYFNKIEEIVEFVDDIRHPTGIYNMVRKYALANGKVHYREVNTGNEIIQVEDYYEPNDPEEYVIIMIDHIGLISAEKRNGVQLSLHESITVLSSDYLIKLRNRFGYIPVVIQQQAQAQESIENKKANRLKPTLDGLADIILGLFSPYRHEIPEYQGYDVKLFKDNIRFLEIIGGRDGGGGTICPLYFDGAVNYFKELPLPQEHSKMSQVHKLIQHIRTNQTSIL